MAIETVPWMIGNDEALHSAEIGRSLAYNATSGALGVTRPRDLQVRQDDIAGTNIKIMPGGGSIPNTSSGGAGQSYMVRGGSETLLGVPANGSAGPKVHYVIIRINDPQYGGTASGPDGNYCYPTLVNSISNLTYPFLPLAKITVPINTSAISQSMIEDIRKVANPRELTVQRSEPIVGSDIGLALTATDTNGEWWPNSAGNQLMYIPEWATRVQISNEFLGVRFAAGSNAGMLVWVEFGPFSASQNREETTQRMRYDASGASNVTREGVIKVADDVYIPRLTANGSNFRDSEQLFVMKGRLSGGTGVSLDAGSGVIMTCRFMEVADPSTS